MRVRPSRVVTVAGLVLAASALALAQRGGLGTNFGLGFQPNSKYDGRFAFVRVAYVDYFPNRQGEHWTHDYPNGEEHFVKIMSELTAVNTHIHESNIMKLTDPELGKNPVIYMCEPGFWTATDTDIKALHDYLQKGGFIIFDDFGDTGRRVRGEWANLEVNMARAFPELRWIDLDGDHPIFHSFFEIDSPHKVPQYYDVGEPIFRGLFVDNDPRKRMIAMANYNTDISEFWEWSDSGFKPIDESNEAYKLGLNEFIYGITH